MGNTTGFKLRTLAAVCLTVAMVGSGVAWAAYQVTEDEMVKFTEEAAAFTKKVGKEEALKEFNSKTGKFWRHDGELYVFAYTMEGVNLALPNNPALVGKNLIDLKDPDGLPLIRKLIEAAKSPKKKGRLTWRWANPASKKVDKKHGMVINMGDWFLGSGYYVKE